MSIGFKKTSSAEDNAGDAEEVDDLLKQEQEVPPKPLAPKIIIVIAAAVLIIVAAMVFLGSKDEGTPESVESEQLEDSESDGVVKDDAEAEPEQGNEVYDEDGNTLDSEGVSPGIPDYEYSVNNQTTPTVYADSDFIKDLNGLDISAVYNVESREYVLDYVSYETRRAFTADGMELYWLEANYSGKPYRVQVPFYYFKDLGASGICKVEMEVLLLAGGGKVISYMQVVPEESD